MAEVQNPTSAVDWTETDRLAFTERWNGANCFNLLAGDRGAREYRTIRQRAYFYDWFDQIREVQGHTILWPAAAWLVATQMSNVENDFRRFKAWLSGNKISEEMRAFAEDGNVAIFEDVFPKLSKVYQDGLRGTLLTGSAAEDWDRATLHQEQFVVVQPVYEQHLRRTPELLDEMTAMATGKGLMALGGCAIAGALDFRGDLRKPSDRFRHGMSTVMGFYKQFKPAIDSSRQRRQRTRPDPTAGGRIEVRVSQ